MNESESYSKKDVEKLLTIHFHEAWGVAAASGALDLDLTGSRSTTGVARGDSHAGPVRKPTVNKAQTGTWMAEKADIEQALKWAQLTQLDEQFLRLTYGEMWSRTAIAEAFELAVSIVSEEIDASLYAVIDEINFATRRKSYVDQHASFRAK